MSVGAVAAVFLVKGHLEGLETLKVLEAVLDEDLSEECLQRRVSGLLQEEGNTVETWGRDVLLPTQSGLVVSGLLPTSGSRRHSGSSHYLPGGAPTETPAHA